MTVKLILYGHTKFQGDSVPLIRVTINNNCMQLYEI